MRAIFDILLFRFRYVKERGPWNRVRLYSYGKCMPFNHFNTGFLVSFRYKWFRDLIMWKNAINYLHHDVVKTAELSLDRNYLIAACPHGIIS